MAQFRWNEWNVEHIAEHGVTPGEAEQAIASSRGRIERRTEDGRFLVWGRTAQRRHLQVGYVIDPDGSFYVIHARPLTDREKRSYRRRK